MEVFITQTVYNWWSQDDLIKNIMVMFSLIIIIITYFPV